MLSGFELYPRWVPLISLCLPPTRIYHACGHVFIAWKWHQSSCVSRSSNSKLNDEICVKILISSNCPSTVLIPYRHFNWSGCKKKTADKRGSRSCVLPWLTNTNSCLRGNTELICIFIIALDLLVINFGGIFSKQSKGEFTLSLRVKFV